jgi:hypothetical protein
MAITAPDVTPQPIQGVRVSADTNDTTFGGGPGLQAVGQQGQDIAKSVGEIATFEKIRADQTAIEEAQAKATALTQNALYNPQTGFMGTKGKDAAEVQQDTSNSIQKGLNDISSTLTGDEQKGGFNKWALEHYGVVNQQMMGHVQTQLVEHDKNSYGSLLDNTASNLAMSHGNQDAINHAFQTIDTNTQAFAQRNRYDKDGTDALMQDAHDKLYSAIIYGKLKFQKDGSAQSYFDSVKDNISPQVQEKLQGDLQEGNLRYQANSAAIAAVQKNPDSEVDALKAVADIKDPDAQEMARKLVSERFAQNRMAIKNDQDDTFMRMQEMVNQKGLTDPAERRNAVPEPSWNKLSSEQQRAIERGGTPDETSIVKWADFQGMVKDGTVKDLSKADFMAKFAPYFTASDAKQALDKWSASQKSGDPKAARDQSIAQSIDQSLTTAGLIHADPKLRHDDAKMLLKQVGDNVHRQIVDYQSANNGKMPQSPDIQKMIDKQTIDAIGNKPDSIISKLGNLVSSNKPVPYETIPDQAKNDILNSARQHGKVLSKKDIENAYPNWLAWKKTNK